MFFEKQSYDYFAKLKEWMDIHKRMPSHNARNRKERKLGKWCNRQKNKCGHKQRDFYKFQRFTNLEYWY